ncbi:class I SAM-dependent methyltransferase [Candidatus Daviesbacteria bacterium]|nr:class I SAM-dependent methyltransferase [Candidatus Daviesbacteria bacterium]
MFIEKDLGQKLIALVEKRGYQSDLRLNLLFLQQVGLIDNAGAVKPGTRILEVGCGLGAMAAELTRRGSNVTALDLNLDELKKGHQRYPEVNFVNADAHTLPFPNQSFDWIISFDAMEHLVNFPQYLAEARRVLVPNGLTAFEIPNKPVSRLWEWAKGNSFKLQQNYHPSVQTYWGLQKLFREAGFAKPQFSRMPFMDSKALDEIQITALAPITRLLQLIPWHWWPQPLYPMFHAVTQRM